MLRGGGEITNELLGLVLVRFGLRGRDEPGLMGREEIPVCLCALRCGSGIPYPDRSDKIEALRSMATAGGMLDILDILDMLDMLDIVDSRLLRGMVT
jgi:hypothetical protein